ncbi:hypothetical protein RRG08_044773 [Elysia crispata]|uniref:Uncharacterized protein n=1 Tax=Elysia crispata TaxID=231223 RepID=A0AAE0ZUD7_9GAST|nr:hypothetical protein RRG08_044773 [Elysia crispata]
MSKSGVVITLKIGFLPLLQPKSKIFGYNRRLNARAASLPITVPELQEPLGRPVVPTPWFEPARAVTPPCSETVLAGLRLRKMGKEGFKCEPRYHREPGMELSEMLWRDGHNREVLSNQPLDHFSL